MTELLQPLAELLQLVLPSWVRLPSLTFSLPHTIYWSGLALFPVLAVFMVRRAETHEDPGAVSLAVSYLLWFWGGFVGLHRFYLRAGKLGLVYILLFLLVLYGNKLGGEARDVQSDSQNQVKDAEFHVERFEKALAQGKEDAAAQLDAARQTLAAAQEQLVASDLAFDQWGALVGGVGAVILILLLIDALLIPGLVRRCAVMEADRPPHTEFEVMERGPKYDPRHDITSPFIRFVGRISGWSGTFVAYWSVLAVFVYYYEVIARYVFNSPTNWAHESMFLMFGMQYLLSGAYALREEAHVRVDVIYEHFSMRTKAMIDVVTSFFFFIFTLTLLVTGYLFAVDSISVWEVSFTEWAIQYWPVKITIGLGALLLLLQGLARLTRDIIFLRQQESA